MKKRFVLQFEFFYYYSFLAGFLRLHFKDEL
jgi:hypothetical protein